MPRENYFERRAFGPWKFGVVGTDGTNIGMISDADLKRDGVTNWIVSSQDANNFHVLFRYPSHGVVRYFLMYRFSRDDWTDHDELRELSGAEAARLIDRAGFDLPEDLRPLAGTGAKSAEADGVSRARVRELAGVSDKTITRAIQRGDLKQNADRTFNSELAMQWIATKRRAPERAETGKKPSNGANFNYRCPHCDGRSEIPGKCSCGRVFEFVRPAR